MNLTVEYAGYGRQNAWLGSAHGTDATQTITLDLTSGFKAADHFENGIVKSGLPLTKLSSGKYGLLTGDGELAGFLYQPVKAPADLANGVGAALLEHGRVKTANLPVTVSAASQKSAAGRIIFA